MVIHDSPGAASRSRSSKSSMRNGGSPAAGETIPRTTKPIPSRKFTCIACSLRPGSTDPDRARQDGSMSAPWAPWRGAPVAERRICQRGVLEGRMLANDIDALADRIAETAAQLDAATHRLLTDIRAFDQRGGWGRQGALSCAHWLSWRCGIALGAAREKVRVAQALGKLARIDAALARGEISF